MPEIGRHEFDDLPVDKHLARVLEVDRDPIANHRLYLSQTPVWSSGMAHELSRGQHCISGFFEHDGVTIP